MRHSEVNPIHFGRQQDMYGDIFSPSLDKINTPVTPSVWSAGYIKSSWNGIIGLDKCVDEKPLSQYCPF